MIRTSSLRRANWLLLATCALLWAACGDNASTAKPCDGEDSPEACGNSCDGDTPCEVGFYCDESGECTADCSSGGNECGPAQSCNAAGQCVDNGGVDGGGQPDCPNVTVRLDPEIPTVVILIDQSGSMDQDLEPGLDRWTAVQNALTDPTSGVVTKLQDKVNFGATLYSSIDGNLGGATCPLLVEEPPSLDNLTDIAALFVDNSPQEDTPTASSVNAVVANFPPANIERPEPQIIILATDGNPDRCDDPDAHDALSQMMSEEAVQAAHAAGLPTFVLSVGDDVAEAHLARLARAGAGQDLDTGDAQFFVATDAAALESAFDVIINGVRTCDLALSSSVDLSKADQGLVRFNGMNLVFGDDWEMIDADNMRLVGDACDEFLSSPIGLLEADFPCGVIVL